MNLYERALLGHPLSNCSSCEDVALATPGPFLRELYTVVNQDEDEDEDFDEDEDLDEDLDDDFDEEEEDEDYGDEEEGEDD